LPFGLGPDDLHRPQKTGGHKFGVGLVILRRSEPIRLHGVRLPVADDSVYPGIRHLDFDLIRAWLQSAGDVDAIWRLPQNPESLAVDRDFREVLDVTQVEPQTSFPPEPLQALNSCGFTGCWLPRPSVLVI
jgi:hypothetical protein